jgi:stage II sporulation protein D
MTVTRQILAALAVVALGATILSCQERGSSDGPLVPAVTQPVPATQKQVVEPPTSIIKMNKPKLLGPVIPAVIALPSGMGEPLIRVKLTGEHSSPPWVKKSAYRGRIESVRLANGNFVAVNVLPLDSYLQGVLAKELYGSWDLDAYRSQAIAARTFALFQILATGAQRQWDVNNDESSQMYGGIAGETAKSREAVRDTKGMVLMSTLRSGASGIFCSFYSACIGGASQNPAEAWGDPVVPALVARKLGPVDAQCPKYAWPALTVTKADITRCVRSWGERNGIGYLQGLGAIRTVAISKKNAVTGRPVEFLLTDVGGKTAPIRAEEFRLALLNDPEGAAPKPFSSNFGIRDVGAAIELVNGRGYGHGIGLSQWGAQALALKGWDYRQILGFYYPGAELREAW